MPLLLNSSRVSGHLLLLLKSSPRWLTVVAVLAFSLLIRRLTLEDVEMGGDALESWFFSRQWLLGTDFSTAHWTHHSARVGVNGWIWLSQRLFGTEPSTYFIAPVLAATVQAVFTFLTARRVGGALAGLAAVLVVVTFPPMSRAGSQALPGVFSGAYVIVATYLYTRYHDAERGRAALAVACALCLGGAYLAKVPNLFFVPGFALVLWQSHRRRTDILWFFAALALVFALECAYYATSTEYWSRLDIIMSTHLSGRQTAHGNDLTFLIRRFTGLTSQWKMLYFSFFPAWLGVMTFSKDKKVRGVCLLIGGFLLIKTCAVRGLFPIRLLERFLPRYLVVTVPLIAVVHGCFLRVLVDKWQRSKSPSRVWGGVRKWMAAAQRPVLQALLTVFVLGVVSQSYYSSRGPRAIDKNSPFAKLAQRRALLADTYKRGLPLVEFKRKKSLLAAWRLYLPDELIVGPNGLTTEKSHVRKIGRHYWLSKNPPKDLKQAAAQIKAKRCIVGGKKRKRWIKYRPGRPLPKSCTDASAAAQ